MDPFRDPAIREAIRRAREIMNNPAFRKVQEIHQQYGHLFDYWNRIVNSPEFETLREAQERLRGLDTSIASPNFIVARDFLMQNEVALRIINSPEWRAMLEAQMRQRDLLAITNWTTAKAVTEVTQFISNNIYIGFFSQSFAAEILEILSRIEEPTDEQSLQNFSTELKNLLTLVTNKCKELVPNSINYWAMFSVSLSIFVFLYQSYEGMEAEKRIVDLINQTKTEILKEVEQLKEGVGQLKQEVERLKPAKVKEVYYVVQWEAKLKSHPRPKSVTIQILSVNQRVKLIKAKGKWIYVEYFDYIEGIPKMGWILKKYTMRLEN